MEQVTRQVRHRMESEGYRFAQSNPRSGFPTRRRRFPTDAACFPLLRIEKEDDKRYWLEFVRDIRG